MMRSSITCGGVANVDRSAAIRRSTPHSSSDAFIASLIPSVNATSKSPDGLRFRLQWLNEYMDKRTVLAA
jgi:hypothetical protein